MSNPKYELAEILAGKRFTEGEKDFIRNFEDGFYTEEEVRKKLEQLMKKVVL